MRNASFVACFILIAVSSFLFANDTAPPAASISLSKQDQKVRVALVTGVRSKDALNAMALAEVQLSTLENVTLLERGEINKLLEEQELILSGMGNPATAVRVGKILTVDLLAVLEGNPKAKKQKSMGLVVFDARTGARLCDETLQINGEKTASRIVETIKTAVEKYRSAPETRITVSIVAVRNVDLPPENDVFCYAIGRLVERALVDSQNITLLERRQLEHVLCERAASPDAPANALLASLQRIELEISQAREGRLKATAFLTSPDGKKQRIEVTAKRKVINKLVDQLAEKIAECLDTAISKRSPNPKAEAKRLLQEADFQNSIKHYANSTISAEAALALAPNDPEVWKKVSNIFCTWSDCVLNRDQAGQGRRSHGHNALALKTRKEALSYAIRSADLILRYVEQHISKGDVVSSLKQFRRTPLLHLGYRLQKIMRSPGERNEETDQMTETLRRRCEHLMLDILAPQYSRDWKRGWHSFKYLQPYARIMDGCWRYLPNSARWTDVMVDHAEHVMRAVDRQGPLYSTGDQITCSYLFSLAYILAPTSKTFSFELTASDYERFERLFKQMERHRLPGMQAFGKTGHLWIAQSRDGLDNEEAFRRARSIIAFAKKKIKKPGVKRVDAERVACYDAMLNVINIASLTNQQRLQLLDDMFAYMLSRKESQLGVVRMAAFPYSNNHWNYGNSSRTLCWAFEGWRWHIERADDDVMHGHQMTKQFESLAASNKIRYLDGQKQETKRLLQAAMQSYRLRAAKIVIPESELINPWTKVRSLIDTATYPGMRQVSLPLVHKDTIYVVGVFQAATPYVELFRIAMNGFTVEPIGKMPLPSKVSKGDIHVQFARSSSALRVACDSKGSIYCATPLWGGISVFPLDGSSSYRLSKDNVEGMPTDQFDDIVAVGNKIFALTSGQTSYVHWYDPDNGGWQVIASSRRAEKKTPLDKSVSFHHGSYYDPYHHRILFSTTVDHSAGRKVGLFQFDIKKRSISEVKRFRGSVRWSSQPGQDRLWFGFSPPHKEAKGRLSYTGYIYEYNIKTNQWREAYRWTRLKDQPVSGIAPCETVIRKEYGLRGPIIEADGWLWSRWLASRVSIDGKTFQKLRSPIKNNNWWGSWQYLPERRAILWNEQNGLWYLELPEKPDLPPSKKAKKKAGHSAKSKKGSSTK